MDFAEALKKAEAWLDEIEGVQGVGEGEVNGESCITVFVAGPEAADKIPGELGGHKIVIEQSEYFQAQ